MPPTFPTATPEKTNMSKKLFDLGRIVATPGALALGVDFSPYIGMHQRGYWGDVCQDDWQANDQSVKEGSRILSAYEIKEDKIWIITEDK